uniref:General transcription factor IIH subunit 3 n=1 Tax=Trichobilharzia regenti TaxID=157069 RepID=A0AA85JX22_TRIRE|nr:unnamed protein product [Trichobilharzia regenti]
MSSSEVKNLLLLILDMTPATWGSCTSEFGLPDCIEAVLGFANSYLMLSSYNELAMIGVTPCHTKFIYPNNLEHAGEPTNDGQNNALSCMNNTVRQLSLDLVTSCSSSCTQIILAGAIIKALCYHLRRCRELQPTSRYMEDTFPNSTEFSEGTEKITSRIMIIKASDDNSSQYLSLMNSVFTAQKLHVPIDTCVLPLPQENESTNTTPSLRHSSLLQQAADLTGGIYLQVPRVSGLLQYLLSVFLPSSKMRASLLLPDSRSSGSSFGVDFRAACFCHKRLIDIGYVCSVCLSVFCEFSPICSTCNTPFVLPGIKIV